ncbi:mucin-binding protein, partial [Latilactobacillus sakei]
MIRPKTLDGFNFRNNGLEIEYSTSGSIADYKKQGYELVTDGYPADLT